MTWLLINCKNSTYLSTYLSNMFWFSTLLKIYLYFMVDRMIIMAGQKPPY